MAVTKVVTKFLVCYEKAFDRGKVVKGNVLIDQHPLSFVNSYNAQGALNLERTCMILTNFVEVQVPEKATYNLAEF